MLLINELYLLRVSLSYRLDNFWLSRYVPIALIVRVISSVTRFKSRWADWKKLAYNPRISLALTKSVSDRPICCRYSPACVFARSSVFPTLDYGDNATESFIAFIPFNCLSNDSFSSTHFFLLSISDRSFAFTYSYIASTDPIFIVSSVFFSVSWVTSNLSFLPLIQGTCCPLSARRSSLGHLQLHRLAARSLYSNSLLTYLFG